MGFLKRVLLTGRVKVNGSIKERQHSKISQRKQFTQHTLPHKEIIDQLKPKVHDTQTVLQAMSTFNRDVRWLIHCLLFLSGVRLVILSL